MNAKFCGIDPASTGQVKELSQMLNAEMASQPAHLRDWFKMFQHVDADGSGRVQYPELENMVRVTLSLPRKAVSEEMLAAVWLKVALPQLLSPACLLLSLASAPCPCPHRVCRLTQHRPIPLLSHQTHSHYTRVRVDRHRNTGTGTGTGTGIEKRVSDLPTSLRRHLSTCTFPCSPHVHSPTS